MAILSRGTAGRANMLTAAWERDVEEKVPYLVGDDGKLTKFSSLAGSKEAKSFKHEWLAADHRAMLTTIAVTPANPTTALTFEVVDDNLADAGDVIVHESGETFRIQSVTHGAHPTWTVEERSRGRNVSASLAATDELYNMGPAQDDGSDLGVAYITQDVFYENPVQTYWRRIEFDNTTLAVNEKGGIYGGDFKARKRGEVMSELLQKMDMNAIHGEAAETGGVGTDTVRTLGGLRNFIEATERSTIGTLNKSSLAAFAADKGFMYGGEKKMVICSYNGAEGLAQHATSNIEYAPGGKTIGFTLRKYVTTIGEMTIMPHFNLSLGTAWDGLYLFVPENAFRKAVLRPFKLLGNINVGTKDVETDAYIGAHTFEFGHPRHYAEINGVTAWV